jgi:hypothetical protein
LEKVLRGEGTDDSEEEPFRDEEADGIEYWGPPLLPVVLVEFVGDVLLLDSVEAMLLLMLGCVM